MCLLSELSRILVRLLVDDYSPAGQRCCCHSLGVIVAMARFDMERCLKFQWADAQIIGVCRAMAMVSPWVVDREPGVILFVLLRACRHVWSCITAIGVAWSASKGSVWELRAHGLGATALKKCLWEWVVVREWHRGRVSRHDEKFPTAQSCVI